MNISEAGINLIKKFEGCRLTAYKCPAGIWTIGYGHTGSDVYAGKTITQVEADKLLKTDLMIHCNNVSKLVKVPLNQNQFDALVSFEYNVGYGAFKDSTMLKFINTGHFALASGQFDRWIYANKKVLQGLVNRRKCEKELFLKK